MGRLTLGRRMWQQIVLAVIWLVMVGSAGGQERGKGQIVGRVEDGKTGEPLVGVNVWVRETVIGTATDVDGRFSIVNLPAGTYAVEASMMGYKKQLRQEVRVRSGETVRIAFALQPTVLLQPTVVVTATKRKQHIEDAPTSVDVVQAAEIQARSVTTLDEVLQNTAGLGIIKGQIDLRGSTGFNWAAGSRVLLMVDGHPLISGDTGGINWDAIPVEEVERVEVVKGAGSALYGSNAMAGMVNIITRDPASFPETRFKVSWGFYDKPAYDGWCWTDRFVSDKIFTNEKFIPPHTLSFEGIDFSHSRRFGNVGLLFTVGRKRSSGYQQNGHYSRWNALGKVKINFSPNQSLMITGNWALNDRGDFLQWISQERPMEVPPEALGDRVRSEKGNVHLTFQHGVNQKLAYTLKANAYRYDWRNDFHDNQDYAVTDRFGTEAQVDYLWRKHALTFGSEITAHHAQSLIYGNQDTWDYAVYGEDELKFSPLWTLTLGTRYDYHRVLNISSDHQVSPRMGLVFRPHEGTSFRFSAGHGFRAPSIAEVFANITVSGFRVVPNLDLREAERAWSFELGMRQVLDFGMGGASGDSFWRNPFVWAVEHFDPSFVFDIAFFWSRYRDMIDVDINPELMAFQFMNRSRARIEGAELRLTGSVWKGHVSGNAGYTYVDTEDLDTEKVLPYRSQHRVNTGIALKFWRLTLGWDYRYASRIEEVVNVYSSDERVPMHVMDARVILDLDRVQIGLEGKNLRNYHYTLRQRFLEPIRHFVVTLRGDF